MANENTNYRKTHVSAGGTSFAYDFKIYSESSIKVTVANADGSSASVKLLSTDYTVTGAGNANGGSVVFTSAVTSGKLVILELAEPLKQTLDLTTADALPATELEAALDRLGSEILTLKAQLARCLALPDSTPATTQPTIPDYNIATNQSLFLRLGVSGIEAAAAAGGSGGGSLTTKGDILNHNGSSEVRLPVGADYRLLMALASETTGMKWEEIHSVPGVTGVIGGLTTRTNLFQNGQMLIWQRGTTFVSPTAYSCSADRWRTVIENTTGNVTLSRSTNVPTVTSPETMPLYSLRVACNTADGAVGGTDYVGIRQAITPGVWKAYAQRPFTISFWCRSNLTGTYAVALNNLAQNRGIVVNYTINAADTWEWKTILIPASPSAGTWVYEEYNGTNALTADWTLMCGTSVANVSASGAWETTTGIARRTPTANVNLLSSTSNYFELYGVQADIGLAPVSQRAATFEEEWYVCQRHYQKSFAYVQTPAQSITALTNAKSISVTGASTSSVLYVKFPYELWSSGGIGTVYNPGAANAQVRNLTRSADGSATTPSGTDRTGFKVTYTSPASQAVGDEIALNWSYDSDFGTN